MEEFANGLKCLDCKHCFIKSPLFNKLTERELELLNDTRLEVDFKEEEIIYKQGSPLTHLVIIHSGLGKVYFEGNNNRSLILTLTQPLELNGGIGVFLDQRHHSSLMALTDCKACFIEINTFKSILSSNTEFMNEFLKEYAQRIAHIYNQLTVLTQKNMEGRMADAIIYLKDHIFLTDDIDHLTKKDFADLTAMTKESAIRVLKMFKEEGHITIDKLLVKILNKKALQKIALHG